jgi:hypothetical protein
VRKFGAIVSDAERPPSDKKWWQFWKTRKDYEFFQLPEVEAEACVVYFPQNSEKHKEIYMEQVMEFFKEQGIEEVVNDHDGAELLYEITPEIIRKMAKTQGKDSRACTAALIDENFTERARKLAIELAKKCRYLAVITQNKKAGERAASEIFDKFGLPVEVFSEMKGKFDFIAPMAPPRVSCKKLIELPVQLNPLALIETLWKIGAISSEDIVF